MIAEGQLVSQPFERLVVADPEIHAWSGNWRGCWARPYMRSPHAITDLDGRLMSRARLNPEQRDAVKNAPPTPSP
jgi:hypothetical protein